MKPLIALFGFVFFALCNIVYDYTGLGSEYWFLGNSVALFCYALSSSLKGAQTWVNRLIVWVALGSLFEEFTYFFDIEILGTTPLSPNVWEYLSMILFFIFEYLTAKGWLRGF